MKKIIIILNCLLLVIVIWSCAAKQLPPPESAYEEGAIKVHVKADHQLNLSDGKAHTLLLYVVQKLSVSTIAKGQVCSVVYNLLE